MARPAKKERNELIKSLHKKGKTYVELSKMFNLHISRIGQIVTGTSSRRRNSRLSTEAMA